MESFNIWFISIEIYYRSKDILSKMRPWFMLLMSFIGAKHSMTLNKEEGSREDLTFSK